MEDDWAVSEQPAQPMGKVPYPSPNWCVRLLASTTPRLDPDRLAAGLKLSPQELDRILTTKEDDAMSENGQTTQAQKAERKQTARIHHPEGTRLRIRYHRVEYFVT